MRLNVSHNPSRLIKLTPAARDRQTERDTQREGGYWDIISIPTQYKAMTGYIAETVSVSDRYVSREWKTESICQRREAAAADP